MSWPGRTPFRVGERLTSTEASATRQTIQPSATDVAIVGGGVIGLSIGWRLAAAGLGVTVFERDEIGAGASLAATGMLAAATELEPGGADLLTELGDSRLQLGLLRGQQLDPLVAAVQLGQPGG